MSAPWKFSWPPTPGGRVIPNLPSEAGAAAGAELARLVESDLARARESGAPAPCVECAFVKGTQANRSGATVMDAVKCVLEGEPFFCHLGLKDEDEPTSLCRGYLAARATVRRPSEARS